jgi:hypothetical protein
MQHVFDNLRAELVDSSRLSESEVATCALAPMRGFASWLRESRACEVLAETQPVFASALRAALEPSAGAVSTDVHFVDADGDSVHFHFTPDVGLQVAVGEASLQNVRRVRVAEDTRAVLFLTEGAGAQALQVVAPEGVDLAQVTKMAEASAILPMELCDYVLKLGRDFLLRRASDGKRVADPVAHFHLSAGASLGSLHWRADESHGARLDSLGIMVTFIYDGSSEADRAAAYAERGVVTFEEAAVS